MTLQNEIEKKIKQKGKDFIVVKDHKTAEELFKSRIPSLEGMYIIVAPDGLEFVSLDDLKKLPQVSTLIQDREKKAVEGFGEWLQEKWQVKGKEAVREYLETPDFIKDHDKQVKDMEDLDKRLNSKSESVKE